MSTATPTPYVPYQAYKSKRHTRTVSLSTPPVEPNGAAASPPSQTRHVSSSSADFAPKMNGQESMKAPMSSRFDVALRNGSDTPVRTRPVSMIVPRHIVVPETSSSSGQTSPTSPGTRSLISSVAGIQLNDEPLELSGEPSKVLPSPVLSNRTLTPAMEMNDDASSSVPSVSTGKAPAMEAGPSTIVTKPTYNPRRSSTFRHVPLRPAANTAPKTSSPLRPATTHSRASSVSGLSPLSTSRHFDQQVPDDRPLQPGTVRSPASVNSELSPDTMHSNLLKPTSPDMYHQRSTSVTVPPPAPKINLPQRTSSLPPPVLPTPIPPPKPSPSPTPVSTSSSRVASPLPQSTPSTSVSSSTPTMTYKTVYRPGFQPKGVYRPLTDDFLACRKRTRDAERIEQTRLERRFEKLVELHFSEKKENGNGKGKEKSTSPSPSLSPSLGTGAPGLGRRASSFFEDLSELRSKNASELWRGVLENRVAAMNGGKGDIRGAEQRITPWQDDAEVTHCPHCSASFHPLTNRKHHCRLCGRIICSLPVKKPQRPVECSLLFVSDPKTGRIEEVKEGVDYGVKPRARTDAKGNKPKGESSDEKFLKGVRICRECKPVMLRQQYRQESKRTPAMIRLYDALIALESEIEEDLPHFQELMMSLSNNPDEAPTKEASAIRKHLLQCFSDYDAIAKRIRRIPCPGGPGSSQDRIQAAIQARAGMFLQKKMFPLQSLPKPKKRSTANAAAANGEAAGGDVTSSQVLDADSELARALQPLLEQEALLETFVEEATAHRKFEDARTLRVNLAEIRAEIDRIVVNADGGM